MIKDLYIPEGDTFPPPPEKGEVRLPNGCTLYWETGEQGREYISDEVGGGITIWHTALVDQSTLLAAIVQEQAFQKLEQIIQERANAAAWDRMREQGPPREPTAFQDFVDSIKDWEYGE
jgi:hypothetical protein